MKNKLPIKFITWYQDKISANTEPRCRYYPTCSNYAKECYQKFNFFKASFLTTKRLLRCNRFHKCGYDPVPLTKEEKLNLEKENTADKNIE
ncbi:MAG: membrane protein insertion efficiency factor YidD [Anaeroplasma sp.]|nr:membrane protein insertion efficiency factor YidD [Anaeroplasma sp.]